MAHILILDNEQYRREKLTRYLSEVGYNITAISGPEQLDTLVLPAFDLFVLNLYPDVDRTWGVYLWLKQRYPCSPVLVYMKESFQAFRGLKQAIGSILSDEFESSCGGCVK